MTSLNFFCNTKVKMPTLNQSFVVYEFVCPGCSANYVEKTERTLFERNVEHAWNDKDSVVNIHLNECNGVQHVFNITKLTPSLFLIVLLMTYRTCERPAKSNYQKAIMKRYAFQTKRKKQMDLFFFSIYSSKKPKYINYKHVQCNVISRSSCQ